jgi:cysteine-rich repeat protein
MTAFCGDSFLNVNEECDDANMDATDDCTNACTVATCGDSIVWANMEDCDDGNMLDTDACVGMCTAASCGDGLLHAGVETCDDGNMLNTDMCTNACLAAVCGDGFLQGNEQCDDGNNVVADGCSMCTWDPKIAFVTSTTHTGNLGGLAGADAICQARAQAANLPGTYLAWLSTAQGSPSTRFTQWPGRYLLTNASKIADNWADLTYGTLDANFTRTEINTVPPNSSVSCNGSPRMTWTGTNPNGTPAANNCSDFTTTVGTGAVGRNTIQDSTWTVCDPAFACTVTAPLYCVQQ